MTSPAAERLLVVTPWWPSADKPFSGSFVASAVAAVREHVGRVDVVHLELRGYGRRERLRRLVPGRSSVDAVSAAVENGVEVDRLPVALPAGTGFAPAAARAAALALRAWPQGRGCDVVHAHTVLPGGAVARRLAPDVPLVVTEHASYLARLLDDPAARDAYGEVVSAAAAVLCVGAQMRADLVAAFPELADRFTVLPNAVEVPAPRPSPPRPGLPGWVCVGSLISRKRPETVLEAFAAAAREQEGMSLAFVGSGPLEAALKAQAQELGVAERVRCVGSVSHREALELIGAADVLVHLADHETFGMSVAEALGLGTPVIVTASAGPTEVLRGVERAAGELLTPGAAATDVAAAWRRLVARQGELDGSATRRHVLEHYGPVAVGERLAALYARVQTRQEQA